MGCKVSVRCSCSVKDIHKLDFEDRIFSNQSKTFFKADLLEFVTSACQFDLNDDIDVLHNGTCGRTFILCFDNENDSLSLLLDYLAHACSDIYLMEIMFDDSDFSYVYELNKSESIIEHTGVVLDYIDNSRLDEVLKHYFPRKCCEEEGLKILLNNGMQL